MRRFASTHVSDTFNLHQHVYTCDSHLTSAALWLCLLCAWSFKIIAHSDTIKTLSVLHFSLSLQLQFKKLFFFLQGFPVTRELEHVHQFHRYSARWGLLRLFCLENVTIITDLTCTLLKACLVPNPHNALLIFSSVANLIKYFLAIFYFEVFKKCYI